MKKRRKLIGAGLALATTRILPAESSAEDGMKSRISHHVFFWLKNPESKKDFNKLVAGLKALAAIPQVKDLVVGVPAGTEKRDVVDDSYAVSELMFFDSLEDQASYQAHPIHKKFVEECGPLMGKVVVYDTRPV